MYLIHRFGFLTAAACATIAASVGAICAHASALDDSANTAVAPHVSDVVGGQKAPLTPWIVQLTAGGGRIPAGSVEHCTGVQVNAFYVLTARHCTEEVGGINVYQSNSTLHRGNPIHGLRPLPAPRGDIALVPLATASPLPSYAPLNLISRPAHSGRGTLYGFGLRGSGKQAQGLYTATVALSGRAEDLASGLGQHVTGITGASNQGDSGGPLVVRGRVTGLCSKGDEADPGTRKNAGSTFSVLSQAADWIRSSVDSSTVPAESATTSPATPSLK